MHIPVIINPHLLLVMCIGNGSFYMPDNFPENLKVFGHA